MTESRLLRGCLACLPGVLSHLRRERTNENSLVDRSRGLPVRAARGSRSFRESRERTAPMLPSTRNSREYVLEAPGVVVGGKGRGQSGQKSRLHLRSRPAPTRFRANVGQPRASESEPSPSPRPLHAAFLPQAGHPLPCARLPGDREARQTALSKIRATV